MVCLIKQSGAEIVSWFIGPTLESVALQCGDDSISRELMSNLIRYTAYGCYRLRKASTHS